MAIKSYELPKVDILNGGVTNFLVNKGTETAQLPASLLPQILPADKLLMPDGVTSINRRLQQIGSGNLIDNAMTAAKCTEEKYVGVSVNMLNKMVSIRVDNSVKQEIPIKNGEIWNKGIGILNIERCVETYMGSIIYSCKNGILCCDIILNRPENE